MLDSTTLLLFLGATLALNLTPGPDMLYVVARSASEGRASGIVSALGIAGGGLILTVAVSLGLAGLLQAVPIAFEIVRYAGAAYLIYLGVRTLLEERSAPGTRVLRRASHAAVFWQGVLTNVLNPKVVLFFLAFLPQFVSPAQGPAGLQLLLLGTMFNLSSTSVNLVVALGASRVGDFSRSRLGGSAVVLQRLTGLVFIGLGARLALMRR